MTTPLEERSGNTNKLESPDEQIRRHYFDFNKWWTGVWDRSNAGKFGILLVLFAFALPFLIVLGTAIVAWLYIWPMASTVTERLAVLSFVFVVLVTIGYQVKAFADQIVIGLFYMRRKRKTKGRKLSEGKNDEND